MANLMLIVNVMAKAYFLFRVCARLRGMFGHGHMRYISGTGTHATHTQVPVSARKCKNMFDGSGYIQYAQPAQLTARRAEKRTGILNVFVETFYV